MKFSGRNVLVTGAGGFLGSHMADRLVREGARVRALIHYNAQGSCGWLDHSPHAREMEIVPGDVRDVGQMLEVTRGVDVIYHFAALTTVPHSYRVPASFVHVNVEGTLNLLEGARLNGAQRFVQASTSQIYGTAQQVPITEAHPLQAQSPYSATKIAADKLVEAWYRTYGLPVVSLTTFCTYGARQSIRNIVPTVITQLLAGPVVRLGNVHPRRDYNYVDDAIEAFALAGCADGVIGERMNVAGRSDISIGDLARTIARLMGREIVIEPDPVRARPPGSEVERLLGDNSRAERLLGWKHNVELEEGLGRTIAWYERNHALVRAGGLAASVFV